MKTEPILLEAIARAIKTHGTYRAAGKALGINYAYLHRLQSGLSCDPRPEVLKKLGLRKRVTLEWT